MTLLGIVALIILVVAGILVLRVKSDPMEKESVREFLADSKGTTPGAPPKDPE
jgi:hypothetical protein